MLQCRARSLCLEVRQLSSSPKGSRSALSILSRKLLFYRLDYGHSAKPAKDFHARL